VYILTSEINITNMAFSKKSKKDAPTTPNHPSSGAALPKRPPDLDAAAKELSAKLGGVNVVSGHGFGDGPSRNAEWRLFVFTDDKTLVIPEKFANYRVSTRAVPAASPAWGKLAVKLEKAAREKEAQEIKDNDSDVEYDDSVEQR
jgi:hypothetical protein